MAMLEVGQIAPDFELPDLDGKPRSLRQILSAGPALLAFFKISCPVCQFTFPFLERLYRGGDDRAPQLIGISQDDAESTVSFNQAFGVTFPVLLDTSSRNYPAGTAYRITNVPSLFLVEKDGRISQAAIGFVKAAMEDLGRVFGVAPFREGETVPAIRPG
ncbi:MAG: TlpA family protein disulfide reductase [Acidobacteriota bacterium]|nr:TlpA family protein disulfide reductase [Acidobacteriota bacterium]